MKSAVRMAATSQGRMSLGNKRIPNPTISDGNSGPEEEERTSKHDRRDTFYPKKLAAYYDTT